MILSEASELASALYQKMQPAFDVGDRITDGVAVGNVVGLVLFPSGWDVHVNWDEGGVAVTSVEHLSPARE